MATRSPHLEEAWLGAGHSLVQQKQYAQAEDVLARAQERFPHNARVAVARGWNAMNLGNRSAAERLWRDIGEKFPDDAGCHVGLCFILRNAGRTDELERLIKDLLVKFPESSQFQVLHAAVSAMRGQWQEAADRYTALRIKYPNDRSVVLNLSEALRHISRVDEADQVLAEGCAAFPDQFDVAMEYARMATRRRDWAQAVARWDKVLGRFPGVPKVYGGMGEALRGAGLVALHEQVLAQAVARFPDDEALATEQMAPAAAKGDYPEYARRLEGLVSRFPNSRPLLADFGFALILSGEVDRAEKVLQEGVKRFPDYTQLRINLARAASARSDWPEAVKRWADLEATNAHDRIVKTELGRARYNFDLLGPAVDTVPKPSVRAEKPAESDADLVCHFESLGEDCEFGLFQRELGAEPLGLLRFAGTTPSKLVDALKCRFEGVGSPEHMVLEDKGGEYVAKDERFGMVMHTHINPRTAAFEPTRKMMLKKTQYLRRKLIEDLEDGQKVFVYRDRYGKALAHLPALRQALDLYGAPKFFVVELQQPGKPNGHIEAIDDRTVIGYIDRHGHDAITWNIPVASWVTLCRTVWKHWEI